MNEDILRKIVETDNVQLFEDALQNGLDVNATLNNCPILLHALSKSSDKISQLLIINNADINIRGKNLQQDTVTPLFLALYNERISTETVKLLLQYGADINSIFICKQQKFFGSKTINHSLFHAVQFREIIQEKRQYIIHYLMEYYNKDVLNEAIKQCSSSLYLIQILVANGAIVPKNIIEVAKKQKVNKEILAFLSRQIEINKHICQSITSLPSDIVDIISNYSQGPEQKNEELLMEAIRNKDILFIKDYIKLGGNPNLIITIKTKKWSLFLYAVIKEAEEIANFLMDNGANINLQGTDTDRIYSPILVALESKNISLTFIEKMINNKANINKIGTIKLPSGEEYINLASLLHNPNVPDDKRIFLFNYLKKRFGPLVLDYVLEGKTSLAIIKKFVSKGAIVNKSMRDKAEKLDDDDDIIEYLDEVLQRMNL